MQRQKLGGRAYDAKDKSLASSITGKSLANEFIPSLSILKQFVTIFDIF